jgi:GNAT superfamily N-acetyltransferase
MSQTNVVTTDFGKRFLSSFKSLNQEWIEKYFEIEAMDLYQLEHPEETILAQGGEIFFVLENDKAVGTCAMVPHGQHDYELAKLAVSPEMRGKGYGDLLMTTVIDWSRKKGAKRITILSNTILEPAIALYKKHGFKTVHLGTHPDYCRCNIEMEYYH